MASTRGIAPANTAAANTTGFNSAMTALANGGTLLCDWDGTVQLNFSPSITVPDGVTILGRGRKTIIEANHEGLTSVVNCFKSTGTNSVTFADITLDGVAAFGAGGNLKLVYHDGTGGTIKLVNAGLKRCTAGVHVSPSTAASASVEAYGCSFEGNNGASNTGLLCASGSTGVRGKSVVVIGCEFTKFGKTGSNLDHGMYVYRDFDLLVLGCRFISSVGTGYGVQVYDTSVTSANASKSRVIEDCFFGPGLTCAGVVTAGVGATTIRGCRFENPTAAIAAVAKTDIDGCYFGVGSASANVIENFGDWTGQVSNCRFESAADKIIVIDQSTCDVRVQGCRFDLASVTIGLNVVAGTVALADCDFTGTPASSVVSVTGGNALSISDNQFRFGGGGTAGIWNRSGSTLARLHVVANNFSQTGGGTSILLTTTPPAYFKVDNYGTIGA